MGVEFFFTFFVWLLCNNVLIILGVIMCILIKFAGLILTFIIYIPSYSQVVIYHFSKSEDISKSGRSYSFLLNRIVNQFIFVFFSKCFFIYSVTRSVTYLSQEIIKEPQFFFFTIKHELDSKTVDLMLWKQQIKF